MDPSPKYTEPDQQDTAINENDPSPTYTNDGGVNNQNETVNQLQQSTVLNVLNDDNKTATSSDNTTSNDEETELKIKINKENDNNNADNNKLNTMDTLTWFRMGTDRSNTPNPNDNNKESTIEDLYDDYIKHLRHAASYKAEFDIYQILAYRAKVRSGAKTYFKPFKTLRGLISDDWSDMRVRWLTTYQRVFCQALVCWAIQTIGVTAILTTQFTSYINNDDTETSRNSHCDWNGERWREDAHLKLLAFLWTAFISLGVSGWVYKARHSGFYPLLLLKQTNNQIIDPSYVSITILQIGLLTNYYVVASSVFGSYILIYQTEGGTETIDMILQAVALFFVLELDNKIVHARDFLSIYKYFDLFIKNNKHKKLPGIITGRSKLNILQKPITKCHGQTVLQLILSIASFFLLVMMTIGAAIAPFLIMICW